MPILQANSVLAVVVTQVVQLAMKFTRPKVVQCVVRRRTLSALNDLYPPERACHPGGQGAYSLVQRHTLNAEANALVDEFNRIVQSVDLNGRKLLEGNLEELRVQGGYGTNGGIGFVLGDALARRVGNESFQTIQNYTTANIHSECRSCFSIAAVDELVF